MCNDSSSPTYRKDKNALAIAERWVREKLFAASSLSLGEHAFQLIQTGQPASNGEHRFCLHSSMAFGFRNLAQLTNVACFQHGGFQLIAGYQ